MDHRNFVVTVKEGHPDEPCSLDFELHEDVAGFGRQIVRLDMRDGTGLEEARTVANAINEGALRIRLITP